MSVERPRLNGGGVPLSAWTPAQLSRRNKIIDGLVSLTPEEWGALLYDWESGQVWNMVFDGGDENLVRDVSRLRSALARKMLS